MKNKKLGFWIFLFVLGVTVIAILGTDWNVKVFRRYQELQVQPWFSMVWGSTGFLATMLTLVLIFIRLVREMRLSQHQSEFLAAVTHELKTPIAAIDLSTSLIRSGGISPDEVTRLWETHEAELKRLRDQVNLLLEAARWQNAAPQPERSPLYLEEWVQGNWENWKRILGPGAFLERKGDALPVQIETDPRMLSLIADTIMDNARKFAKEQVRVHFVTRLEKHTRHPGWKIGFEDEGWGFKSEDSERIFKRFVRSRSGSPFAISGTGLGLYIAASAGRALGLQLSAKSHPDRPGATFWLEGKTK